MTVFKSLLFFLGAASACAFVVLCLWVDIHFWDYNISELSLTEIVQELVLTAIVFIHFRLAKQYNAMRYCHILVGGFFLAMLIRELDALFRSYFSRQLAVVCADCSPVSLNLSTYPLSSNPGTAGAIYPYTLVRRINQRPVGYSGLLSALRHAGLMACNSQ